MGWKEWRERNREKMELALEGKDPVQTRADLTTFFGPRADVYLRAYDRALGKDSPLGTTWSWPAFLFAFVWFFYRRLYIWGAAFILLPIVIGILYPSFSGGAMGVTGVLAKPMYVQAGLSRIRKADALGLTGAEREDYLRRSGGVSFTAGILAGCLYAALFALAIFSIYAKKHGAQ